MSIKLAILNCYDSNHPKTLFNYSGKNLSESELLYSRVSSFPMISAESFNVFSDDFPNKKFDAFIISGSYYNPDRDSILSYSWMQKLLSFIRSAHEKAIPQLGICFGHQMIAVAFGGKVFKLPEIEAGFRKINLTDEGMKNRLFQNIKSSFFGVFFHNWAVYRSSLPFDSNILALSPKIPDQATSFSIGKSTYAVQFHPERVSGDVKIMFDSRKKSLNGAKFNLSESSDANLKVLENFLLSLKNQHNI
ncbi:MAG: type 1 glutamine amidotransferase [Candidatus ainarchaeum sp.]|nr:type 1 glutamine amidotransferase [Candidatus ainarchaeum sp.]